MSDLKSKFTIKIGSEKNFGIVFSIFFLILTIYKYYHSNELSLLFFFLFIIFFLLSYIYPIIFKYPNIIWFKIGLILGYVISPMIMFLIYFLIFFPIGILFKMFNKDPLNLSIKNNISSYWIDYEKSKSTMRNQF